MNFKQLEAFVRVTELQSFTRAAKQLYMSQPAISFQIKALEEDLKVTLFQRNEKKVTLTEAGQLLYPEAKTMLGHYHKIKAGLDAIRGLKAGRLSIGASTIPGEYLLPGYIGKFRRKYSGINISLRVAGSGEVISWVQDRDIDIGVVGKIVKKENLNFTKWVDDELVVITPPGHRWSGKVIAAQELLTEKLILREEGSGTRQSMWEILDKHGVDCQQIKAEMELGSTRAVISAVQSGIGIGFVSRFAAADVLDAGRVQEIKLLGVDMNRSFFLVRYSPEIINYATDAFQELLLKNIGNYSV
ncbi:DNA-binding transcriptional regulator, LysR family [Desulfotomaculum arcticum]|uniref:DNA-binding transcriptional regulator, LysR family n=1 Tax=Desulfotruncus arcticus DSM 17038 TaxID=1121424 RepID=A0A1I2S8W2_9FIRM|nr:selenium metabolism-associated LysR family transcriptional regulator [Desulfotruncus arcticus]SFG46411.1 DNA-binding transcriptional regulator, LysR family [Desulfotomaculum arcticum] [Desulfotruncus arcticus DSM 17038]